MELVEIGFTGKPHGLKGEIKLRILEFYEEDLMKAQSLLIGDPAVPYFAEYLRGGGALIGKLEGLDSREAVQPLSSKPVWLLQTQVSGIASDEEETPWDAIIGWTIKAEGYPEIGPITGIMDMPEHYLAELTHDGKGVLIPLHENLVSEVDEDSKMLHMLLPEGLLDLG